MNPSATIDYLKTAIGAVRVTASERGVLMVDLLGQKTNLRRETQMSASPAAEQLAQNALQQLLEYLDGKRRFFDLPIDWSLTTAFQRNVLEITQFIPFGEKLTYGQIAERLGKPSASRAIGGALGRNPIPIIIPCHRVVAANGALTGFSAADGIRTKQWLLELEGHQIVAQKLA